MPSKPLIRHPSRWVFVAASVAMLGLSGCKSFGWGDKGEGPKGSPEQLYGEARKDLRSGNYQGAIQKYENLEARYPFSEQAKQGQLDLLYVYYKNHSLESAIDQADQFIRENPTHPRIDYAWYIKGLVDFERTPNFFEKVFNADLDQRPPQTARKSFAAFRKVAEEYPKSQYAHDARRRMIYLRNRLADYELNVARYYIERGAWVAAAQRAKICIEQYDGAPAVREAMQILIQSYERLGLEPLTAQARAVYQLNFQGEAELKAVARDKKRRWWNPFD